MGGVGSVCTELTVWEGKTMKTAVKHCVSSAYQIGTGGGVEGRRGLAPPPIRYFKNRLCGREKPHREPEENKERRLADKARPQCLKEVRLKVVKRNDETHVRGGEHLAAHAADKGTAQ